jgi:HSP20 family protein
MVASVLQVSLPVVVGDIGEIKTEGSAPRWPSCPHGRSSPESAPEPKVSRQNTGPQQLRPEPLDRRLVTGYNEPMARKEREEWFWQVGIDIQRISEELSRSGPTLTSRMFWEPRVDLIEDRTCIIVKAELGGVRAEDIVLSYNTERNSLLIRGTRREEDFPASERTGCYQLEIYYGEFEREVRLPELPLHPDGIKAHFRNGLLLVMIPKGEEGCV